MKNKSKLFLVGIIIAAVGVVALIAAIAGGENGKDALVGSVIILAVGIVLGVIGFFKKPAAPKPVQSKPAPAAQPKAQSDAEDDDEDEDWTPSKYKYSRRVMYSKNAVTKFRAENAAYIVLGIATTGTDPNGDKIIDIALIRVQNGKAADVFRSYVNPHCTIPADATNVNGITNDTVKRSPDISALAPKILKFIGSLPIVTEYTTFTAGFMRRELCDHDVKHEYIDIIKMARHAAPELADNKFNTVADRFGLTDRKPQHDALDQANAVAYLFETICAEFLRK